MKITQFKVSGNSDRFVIVGLGSDNKIYIWNTQEGKWKLDIVA